MKNNQLSQWPPHLKNAVHGRDAWLHLQRPWQPFLWLQPQRITSFHILKASGMDVHTILQYLSFISQPHSHESGNEGILHNDCGAQQYEAW